MRRGSEIDVAGERGGMAQPLAQVQEKLLKNTVRFLFISVKDSLKKTKHMHVSCIEYTGGIASKQSNVRAINL